MAYESKSGEVCPLQPGLGAPRRPWLLKALMSLTAKTTAQHMLEVPGQEACFSPNTASAGSFGPLSSWP